MVFKVYDCRIFNILKNNLAFLQGISLLWHRNVKILIYLTFPAFLQEVAILGDCAQRLISEPEFHIVDEK